LRADGSCVLAVSAAFVARCFLGAIADFAKDDDVSEGRASSGPQGTEPKYDCGNFDPINRNLSRYSFVS
jgi:hypothetical protein